MRLDCIAPDLDTFNLTVKVYSLSDEKALCSVDFGYDKNCYYSNDPYTGSTVAYGKSRCELRYEQLGKQSLVIQ